MLGTGATGVTTALAGGTATVAIALTENAMLLDMTMGGQLRNQVNCGQRCSLYSTGCRCSKQGNDLGEAHRCHSEMKLHVAFKGRYGSQRRKQVVGSGHGRRPNTRRNSQNSAAKEKGERVQVSGYHKKCGRRAEGEFRSQERCFALAESLEKSNFWKV